MIDAYPDDYDAEDFAQTVQELNGALEGKDVASMCDEHFTWLIRLLNIAPAAPALRVGTTDHEPMDPVTLTFRTAWFTDTIAHLLKHLGEHMEEALTDPWLRVGAAQFHRDGSNAGIHAWRAHMEQVHTALVALDQLLDATPAPLPDDAYDTPF